jgi:hypothetical protein
VAVVAPPLTEPVDDAAAALAFGAADDATAVGVVVTAVGLEVVGVPDGLVPLASVEPALSADDEL